MSPDNVDDIERQGLFDAIIAATQKWFTTEDGLIHICRLFNLERKTGEVDKEYTIIDHEMNKLHTIDRKDVFTFQGVVVRGVLVPYVDIQRERPKARFELDVTDAPRERCDCCGMQAYCVKEILDPIDEHMKSYCNHCIIYHEHPRVQDQSSHNCEECPARFCKHHWKGSRECV